MKASLLKSICLSSYASDCPTPRNELKFMAGCFASETHGSKSGTGPGLNTRGSINQLILARLALFEFEIIRDVILYNSLK